MIMTKRNLASVLQIQIHTLPKLPQSAPIATAEYVGILLLFAIYKSIGSVAAASWPTAQTAPPAPNYHVATSKYQQYSSSIKCVRHINLKPWRA